MTLNLWLKNYKLQEVIDMTKGKRVKGVGGSLSGAKYFKSQMANPSRYYIRKAKKSQQIKGLSPRYQLWER